MFLVFFFAEKVKKISRALEKKAPRVQKKKLLSLGKKVRGPQKNAGAQNG
jgi:hypothetical protein